LPTERPELHVRLAGTRDRRSIAECDPLVAPDIRRREVIDAAIAARRCWIAERSGAIEGYGVLTSGFFGRDFLELLFVAEAARRQGVGNAILDAIERARGGFQLFALAGEANEAMRNLLERRGYLPSGKIQNLVPGGTELVYLKLPDEPTAGNTR
jgi:GNAT superfamily N-acetyltransferase